MAGISDIMKMLPIEGIARQLGVDPAVATQAVTEGGAAILGGLAQNAQAPEGAAAIQQALQRHADAPDAVDPAHVDTADGQKILGHVFGGQQNDVARTLTDSPKTAGIDFGALLPMLAPIVMGALAKNTAAGTGAAGGGQPGGGVLDAIGGLLGGGADGGQGGLGNILGGLLGGGSGGSAGGVAGVLGGLFGGDGKR